MNISVCIITYNEEWIIGKTIAAIKDIADEIIVVDSYSTDRTVEIAKSFGAKVYQEEFKGDGPQKNSAITKCTGRWILYLDADEVVSPSLKREIKKIADPQNKNASDIYFVRFQTYCFGKHVKYGSCKSFYRVRFFKNSAGLFSNKQVHGEFQIDKEKMVSTLHFDIYHETCRNIAHYIEKLNFYTTEKAQMAIKNNKKPSHLKILFAPMFCFIKFYFLKFGFLDGYVGFQLARLSAYHSSIYYSKLLEAKH